MNLTKLTATEIKTVSIVPVFKNDEGSEIAGTITSTYNLAEQKECVEETKEQTCGNWICGTRINNCSAEVYCGHCPENKTCSSGLCLSDCTNICITNGTKQCSGNGYQTCGNYDSDVCLEWSNVTSCLTGKTCSSGICSSVCTNECTSGTKKCSGNGYQICGNYDADSCLDWSNVTSCFAGWTCNNGACEYNFGTKIITLGQHYNYANDQATVEFVDLTSYNQKELIITTNTKGYILSELLLYNGKIDLTKHWGDSVPLYAISSHEINPTIKTIISPNSGFYSIVYVVRYEDGVPENLQITRNISIKEPKIPLDYSKIFVTDFSTFPDDILNNIDNPSDFNDNMNRAYDSFKELTGEDSHELIDGHITLIVRDIPACGWAGNPIQMDPSCMVPNFLNHGDPGFGPLHELGHDFTMYRSFSWQGDATEMWANFMGFYIYDTGLFPVINDDIKSRQDYWSNEICASNLPCDIFACLMSELKNQYSWGVLKNFFRKYNQDDSAINKNIEEQKKLAVRYLAESAKEVSGKQSDYDYVVNYLVGKGFPHP